MTEIIIHLQSPASSLQGPKQVSISNLLLLTLDDRNTFIAIYQGPQLTVVTKASFQDGRCQIQRIVGARMESSIISSASAI